MQAKLHRWAEADPGRRFDDLFNFVCDPATLLVAFRTGRGHLRCPTIRPHNGFRRCTDIHRRVFRHYSTLSFSQPLPPFPMCTGFPRLEVLRRLRPAPTRSADDEPNPTTRIGYTASGQDQGGSRVHCDSLDEGGAQLYPCGLATTTPQHVAVASRAATHMTARKFPAPIHWHGCAPRPAHIRQV